MRPEVKLLADALVGLVDNANLLWHTAALVRSKILSDGWPPDDAWPDVAKSESGGDSERFPWRVLLADLYRYHSRFWQEWVRSDAALRKLPDDVCARIEALCGPVWRATLQRVLNELEAWPCCKHPMRKDEPEILRSIASRWTIPQHHIGETPFFPRQLVAVIRNEPPPDWAPLYAVLSEFHRNLLAVAASHEKPRPAPATEGIEPTSRKAKRAKWVAAAMLLVRDHPEWSNARIAKLVGKHPSVLSRCEEFQAAAAIARGQKTDVRRGYKQAGGDLDAYHYDPDTDLDD